MSQTPMAQVTFPPLTLPTTVVLVGTVVLFALACVMFVLEGVALWKTCQLMREAKRSLEDAERHLTEATDLLTKIRVGV